LLVDDDVRLLTVLSQSLTLEGFQVETARDAGEALNSIEHSDYDVIVLDVMMPTVDGLTLCRWIRDRVTSPILMLTALDSVADRVTGLESGADDYLTKPFATDELVARIRVLLRRTRLGAALPSTTLQFGSIRLNRSTWQATRDGEPLGLTSMEFRILHALIASPGRVFTRQEILDLAWNHDEAIESNVIDVHIASLRQKLESGGKSRLIQTVRGVGYTLRSA
jgi:two-component system, OmpR family, response regulator MprA